MFYLVGLGLGDAEDVTVKGLKIIRNAKRVYLEAYTSVLTVGKESLEKFYGRELIVADREMVEQNSDEILQDAKEDDIALLIVGDPLGATTHSDIILRAKALEIPFRVIHNASIINAIGACGLQLYNFGEVVSIVFWTDSWQPESFFDKIVNNKKRGLHTLCLLDIKVKEQSIENLMKGKKIFDPPRFMTVCEASNQLIQIINRRKEGSSEPSVLGPDSVCVGVARIGAEDQKIIVTSLHDMVETKLGDPLHSLVIPGCLHPFEIDMLRLYAKDPNSFENLIKLLTVF